METIIFSSLVSFLGGGLLTAVGFMFAFTGRLAKVETKLATLCQSIDKISNNTCPFHAEIRERIARIESKEDDTRRS